MLGRFDVDVIKVSANSRTSAVAGAIAGVIREYQRAEVQAIGAGAVNQAVKALVLATGYLKNDGIDVTCVPEFADVAIEDKMRTAIKLVIEPRK
jgi:stage V sporulation protein S